MPAPYSLIPGVQQLQALATTASGGSGGVLYLGGLCARVTVVLQSTGTTSGGTLVIEEAFFDRANGALDYSGTWSSAQAVNASDVTGTAQKAYHLTGSFWAVRVRIATDITGGGSISAWAWGN